MRREFLRLIGMVDHFAVLGIPPIVALLVLWVTLLLSRNVGANVYALAALPLVLTSRGRMAGRLAIVLFAVSVVLLVGVSLATQPASLERLKGLTFRTLESSYIRANTHARSMFRLHLVATLALAVFVIGLWVYYA